ncbi:MAG: RsmB/NOP family class I SAM-dependent RNA methyltransferase [Candidatus Pacearchaeota archaeon]|nr:RsmB/NOP family class I SAM-dependent RNA methyltransferase [Candidatus Pacearchaeota archaeon]
MKERKPTPISAQEVNKKRKSLSRRRSPEPKPLFLERMQKLLPNKEDYKKYLEILKIQPVKSFRCNSLKITPQELKEKLESKYNWKITQPWKDYPEVMIVENQLEPGKLGRALEHLLGYYYIQELASMLPVIAIKPKENETVLDLCSAPGSKTTQLAAEMKNTGSIIANEVSLGRIKILSSNLERCGVTNTIITKRDGIALCKKLGKEGFSFDKILVDAPCSGEGTLRSSPKTYIMWNPKTITSLSKLQKQLFRRAFEILKIGGEIIYSTCTHAPEENEAVADWALKEFQGQIEIETIELPIKPREGICCWQDEEYSPEIKKCARVYPHDNNTEGFFVSKFKRIK